jgi:rhodanese-related sulfurtransferase
VSDEISVKELQERLRAGDVVVLDVREPDELEAAALPGVVHVPMNSVPERLAELPRDRDIAVLCHSGRRSAAVTKFLHANGFPRARNVSGGIDAWSVHVDPAVPRY